MSRDHNDQFDSHGMFRTPVPPAIDQREWPHLDGPSPVPSDYVRRETLDEAIHWIGILVAASTGTAACYVDGATAFVQKHRRT